jgi:hypothetical protein
VAEINRYFRPPLFRVMGREVSRTGGTLQGVIREGVKVKSGSCPQMTQMGTDGKNANAFEPQGYEPRMARSSRMSNPGLDLSVSSVLLTLKVFVRRANLWER